MSAGKFGNTTMDTQPKAIDGRPFYRIIPARDGLVDVWLSPGEPVPAFDNLTGRIDYNFRVMAVVGVDPEDEKFGGDLEEHIRRHYYKWLASAKEVEM
jgi:hypothetical protein